MIKFLLIGQVGKEVDLLKLRSFVVLASHFEFVKAYQDQLKVKTRVLESVLGFFCYFLRSCLFDRVSCHLGFHS